MLNLFRCGKVTSGLSALRSKDSNCKGDDAAGISMGRIGGDVGSGGDGIYGNRDDNRVSGDGEGIGVAKNLLASSLVKDSVGGWGLKDIIAMTRSASGGGIELAEAGCSSSSSSSSSARSGCSSARKTSSSG
nr:hypothetical protein [Tanacetum cinerariifolium]